MKAVTEYLKDLPDYNEIVERIKTCKPTRITGCLDTQKMHLAHALMNQEHAKTNKIIVTYSEQKAKTLCEELSFYEPNTYVYPVKDFIFFQADIHGNQLTKERLAVYRAMLENDNVTIVTTFSALLSPCLPLEKMIENRIQLMKGSIVAVEAISIKLIKLGYEKVPMVEAGGQFSVRGGVIDIFDLTVENPVRIELWGDEIDSIRSFDVDSQRSIETLDTISIFPATEMVLSKQEKIQGLKRIEEDCDKAYDAFRKAFLTQESARIKGQIDQLREQIEEFGVYANLESYMLYFYPQVVSFLDLFSKGNTKICLDEPNRIQEHGNAVETEFIESMKQRLEKGYALSKQASLLFSCEEIQAKIQGFGYLALQLLERPSVYSEEEKGFEIEVRSISSFQGSFELLKKELWKYKKEKYRMLLFSASRSRAKRLAQDLLMEGMSCFYSEDPERIVEPGEIMVCYGQIGSGFAYPEVRFVIIADTDIFGKTQPSKKKRKKYEGNRFKDFGDLNVGDYVVHENHGLGIYRGIEKVEIEKTVKDYMKIEYRGGGVLYVLATAFHVVQKYSSSDGAKPKLNKLGTQEWNKTKTRVKSEIAEIAKELVELYALRESQEGFQFEKDSVWQKEFEELFPFEETQDQLQAIEDTKQDMQSKKIMDRLICGDVGYGKTEIAIRAAFKAVQDGKQVAYLVPTTILAQQHYETFLNRMKDFPIKIGMLSRFRTTKELQKTISEMKKGVVDIVIGTHRLLSKDVVFKDLGLLIIDEEQRFGVTHKEKMKQIKSHVDVLTLTATPIPRTLHMSLVGIRDMSVLEEAPHERLPIQTYVMEHNDELVREAIVRELSRNGQVYYVYNRVHNIEEIALKVSNLVPGARVTYAHGQMRERELEQIMYDFIEGDIDVLVSTTIIETGLDIPNVNTMIIHDADQMGLSQLYQLRGRVGRSNKTSYAFLMYQKNKSLKEFAEKRLQAIREFTDLGSGFKIAMRDLEIRGAGNILGAKQHGHMEAIGYDLYCKLLNESVQRVKGIEIKEEESASIELEVNAFIPSTYIVNEHQKLDIYKRIASIENAEEAMDMEDELKDRFGKVLDSVKNLIRISLLRVVATKLYITQLKASKTSLTITMDPGAKINAENIPALIGEFEGRLKFTSKGVPSFQYKLYPSGVVKKDEEMILSSAEQIVYRMKEYLLS